MPQFCAFSWREEVKWGRGERRRSCCGVGDEGARDTAQLAAARVNKLLGDYQAPGIDPGVDEALRDYIARRKASMPDAFN